MLFGDYPAMYSSSSLPHCGRAAEFKTSTTGNDEVTFTNTSTVAPPETGRTIHDSEWILLLIVVLIISAGGMTFLRKMKKRY